MSITLFDLEQGDVASIIKVRGRGAFRKRILEMGFIPGKEIRVVKKAPLKDPIEYNVMGYNVSLRNSEAKFIDVATESAAITEKEITPETPSTFDFLHHNRIPYDDRKVINVALVGNPNCGKTTLFNHASGSRERVGNYSGVTVEAKEARFKIGEYTINLVDLPGTYSLSAYSPEELFVRKFITESYPDIVLNVVDGSNLERNLYLTTQLIDLDIKVVIALNMYDELLKSGNKLDYKSLGNLIGIPVIPIISSKGKGIDRLLEKVIEVFNDKDETSRHIHIHYGRFLETAIGTIQQKLKIPDNYILTDRISSRFLAIKLLEKDTDAMIRISDCINKQEILDTVDSEIKKIEKEIAGESENMLTDAKFGFIGGALRETMIPSQEDTIKKSEIVDTFFTHKLWGIPVFILFMWFSFYFTFQIGQYPKAWIEAGVDAVSHLVERGMQAGMLKDLLVQGIIGGVGGVIVFLPNILILFLFISLMEDSGYMARAVFIMDKAMHKIGLHGKSFIPMLMGFGCNVPAILSTRIIESRRDRLLTMLINPFMSCSARLPVYILLISAFFNDYQGTMLFLIYFSGVIIAALSSLLFKKTIFRKEDVPFVMELPPYRVPTMRSLVKHMWHRAEQYLKKIGGVILIASIIIWALGYFPRHNSSEISTQQHQEQSYIGRIGAFIQPVMSPLGFDWKMSVAILTGIAGKEIVVGTIGVLYQADPNVQTGKTSLVQKLKDQTYLSGDSAGTKVFNPVVALSFMMFILIYFPCIAVIAVIRKESGSWKWSLFSIIYTTGLAWLVSLVVYQVGKLLFL
jgi:ferrous iron transport protein B